MDPSRRFLSPISRIAIHPDVHAARVAGRESGLQVIKHNDAVTVEDVVGAAAEVGTGVPSIDGSHEGRGASNTGRLLTSAKAAGSGGAQPSLPPRGGALGTAARKRRERGQDLGEPLSACLGGTFRQSARPG